MLVATMPPWGEKMVMLGGAGVGAAVAVAEALAVDDAAADCVAVGLGAAVPPHAAAMRHETAMSARARLPIGDPLPLLGGTSLRSRAQSSGGLPPCGREGAAG